MHSRVHELRGKPETIHLNAKDKDDLVRALASIARTYSVLSKKNYTDYFKFKPKVNYYLT